MIKILIRNDQDVYLERSYESNQVGQHDANTENKTQMQNPRVQMFIHGFDLLHGSSVRTRVARWFIFKPKIPIWVNFGGPYIGKC
jgi:hypothetical protein